jgi:hypothetical protein
LLALSADLKPNADLEQRADKRQTGAPLAIGSCLEYAIYHRRSQSRRSCRISTLDRGGVLPSAAARITWTPGRAGDPATAARLQVRSQSTRYQRLHTPAHGCERTRSTGRRSPPASRRGPVSTDTNRQPRNASRDGAEGGPSRDRLRETSVAETGGIRPRSVPELCTDKALSDQPSTRFSAAMALMALVVPLKELSRRLTYVGSFDNCTIIELA